MTQWTSHQYQQFRQQERRDWLREQQTDAERNRRQMSTQSTTRTTAQGDRVKAWPDLVNRDDRIADIRKRMADAYDEAAKAADLKRRMSGSKQIDNARFAVLKDGERA